MKWPPPRPPPEYIRKTNRCNNVEFLGAVAKLPKKTTISFVMSVCARLSARMEQLSCHWTYFHEILYLRIFRKSVERIQVSLTSEKNNE